MKKTIGLFVTFLLILSGCQSVPAKDSIIEVPQDAIPTLPHVYSQIVTDYATIVEYRISDNFESDYTSGKYFEISDTLSAIITDDLGYQWHCMLADMTDTVDSPQKSSFGYILKDINDDDIQELFWVCEARTILAIFTLYENRPYLIGAFWPRYQCVITDNDELFIRASGAWNHVIFQKYQLLPKSTQLLATAEYGMEDSVCYEMINGKKVAIEESRLSELLQFNPFQSGTKWNDERIFYLN